jgi:hypothetical protein
MTREQAFKLWPIVKAFGEGKEVQCRVNEDEHWFTSEQYDFGANPDNYRIAPECSLCGHPFQHHMKQGCLHQVAPTESGRCVCPCTQSGPAPEPVFKSTMGVVTWPCADVYRKSIQRVISIDGGKTWTRCEKEEKVRVCEHCGGSRLKLDELDLSVWCSDCKTTVHTVGREKQEGK